jgi:leucyl aminopeptidase
MFLDKHGATSCLAAFQAVVDEKLAINVTCSIGMVENFISDRAYRPSDIITSRKGLTVEIGNTDAEGRLVLADLMHWTQEKFKTTVLIEVSTLTGAIGTALGF